MFAIRVPVDNISTRINAEYYDPVLLQCRNTVTEIFDCKDIRTISKRMNSGPFGSSLLASDYVDRSDGVVFVRPQDCKSLIVNIDNDNVYISHSDNRRLKSSSFSAGSIIITKIGNGIGDMAVVPDEISSCNISGNAMGIDLEDIDSFFAISYLRCKYGQAEVQRGINGGPKPKIDMGSIGDIIFPLVRRDAQKYIGNKVRQAEMLRAWAKRLEKEIALLSFTNEINDSLKLKEKQVNRVHASGMTNRLDPKYYSFKSTKVLEAAEKKSEKIYSFVKSYSNGFEEREFFLEGIDYITVSEVSSGRLDISNAPKISQFSIVPDKARINEKCILVVRTGSVGTAVKVNEKDKQAVISSHLIRLEFETEEIAAAVAIFLNSSAGKILLHKISYGAVQPQIGQNELLNLPIPEQILKKAAEIQIKLDAYEASIRFSQKLTTAAKLLTEALIEQKLTEQDLINAQQTLDNGDPSHDRNILSRLTTTGLDNNDSSLFPDLDQLYQLLEQVANPEDGQ